MRIAITGIRGIPVVYSGFETFAERLSLELTKKGHSLTVYCRKGYVKNGLASYKGVNLVTLPVVKGKGIETFLHSFVATLHAILFGDYDVIYYLGVGSSIFSLLPRLFGIKTVVNVDGLDWKREKWGFVGKTYLLLSEYIATIFPDVFLTDSEFIKNYYLKKYDKECYLIPYGFYKGRPKKTGVLKKLSLKANNYCVWTGRLVPDNHLDELLNGLKYFDSKLKIVLAGSDVIETPYLIRLRQRAKGIKNVLFAGFLKRDDYRYLLKNALCYIETKRSGGTHPSLVEAMGYSKAIVSNNHPANKEVLGKGALYYKMGVPKDLFSKLSKLKKSKVLRKKLGKKAKEKAEKDYSWKSIVLKYEKLFLSLTK